MLGHSRRQMTELTGGSFRGLDRQLVRVQRKLHDVRLEAGETAEPMSRAAIMHVADPRGRTAAPRGASQWRWRCQSAGTRPAGPGVGWSSG
jgi:hypothetical protein